MNTAVPFTAIVGQWSIYASDLEREVSRSKSSISNPNKCMEDMRSLLTVVPTPEAEKKWNDYWAGVPKQKYL